MSAPDPLEIASGEDLVAALAQRVEPRGAWVQAVGTVEDVVLSVAHAGDDQRRSVPGRQTLVSLVGPATGPLGAVLAAVHDGQAVIEAGVLVGARSLGVSVGVGVGAGEAVLSAATNGTSSWADAVKAAAAREGASGGAEPDEDEESDELPAYNDRVIHPVFGLCDVMVVRGERLKIRDVEGTKRLREIHLGVMKVLRPVEQDGRRVFRLAKRD
jgi:hypothetical protein